jgi:tripartite-type tricarboxylate transporter receptor subunit TctC
MKKLLIFLLCVASGAVFAQSVYPNKPVHVIVPFAPGGASDFVARIIQPKLAELLGQPIVIDNRAGAAGNIGMAAAARSAPDGYTLYLGNIGTVAINPAVFPKLAVRPLSDFIPVTQVVDVPSVLVAYPGYAPNSVKDLIASAKAHPGKLNYASPGSGSQNRLEMEVLRKAEGLDMVHVPYKGGAGPAVAGLMGGETHVMFTTAPSAMGQILGGKVKVLAVTSAKRLAQLPQTPTMLESGYSGFVTGSWQGIFVPAGTPKPIVERLHKTVLQTMADRDVIERLAKGGVEAVTSTSPQAFTDFVAAETQRWATVVRESGATVD